MGQKIYLYFEYLILRGTALLVNLFPVRVSDWIARRTGDFIFLIAPKRRMTAMANLDIAFGDSKSKREKKIIVRKSFQNLVLSLLDLFNTPKFTKNADQHFRFKGTEYMNQAFQKGKGIIWVISHLGSWEYLAFLPYIQKYRVSVIGKPMKNQYIYKWVRSLRNSCNLNHIDKKGAAKEVLKELHANHLVAILIDQWASADGLWVDFFGKPTSTTSIPVRFSKRTGAALIPAYCIRVGCGKYEIQVKEPVEIVDNKNWEFETTKKLNEILEQQILIYPEQWSWAHRRWKGKQHYEDLKLLRSKSK